MVSGGGTLAIGGRLSGQVGIQFGPYFPKAGVTDRNNTFSLGEGMGTVEISYEKDGIGFGLGIRPSLGWSGVSKSIGDQQVDLNGSSGTEIYNYNFNKGE
ncbi:polymorphic toxin type 25 domain-containing protein [Pseudomonas sp. D47]|uniref:polymorphic toxin type 25 domain-containing protein n=1 Tax=Pseudomonas sp. D47 TaxID=3159447 RepID=UPI00387B5E20